MSYTRDYIEAGVQQDYIRSLLGAVRGKWLSISVGTIAGFSVLAVGINYLPRTYQGVASVEVLSKTPNVATPDIITGDTQFTDETAGTELAIFKSPELRMAVIEKLKLTENPQFNPDLKASKLTLIRDWLHGSPLAKYVPPTWLASAATVPPDRQLYDTVQTFADRVIAEPVSHSKVIEVRVTTNDPQLSAQVANATVDAYIAAHQQQKEDAYRQAYQFSSARLPALRKDMLEKAAAVDEFRRTHQMVSGQYAAILREKLTEANKQLTDAQARLEALRSEVAQSRVGDPLSNPAVLASQTIAHLREQQAKIASDGAARSYSSANFQQQRAAVESEIRAEALRVIRSLPDQVAAQQSTVASLQKQVESIAAKVSEIDTRESELAPLQNDADIAKKQYSSFLTSDTVSRPDVAFTAVNVRQMSAAQVPYKPHFPNMLLMLPAAFVLSLLGNTGLALYRSRRVGFLSLAQIQDVFRIDPIGRIPLRNPRTEQAFWEAVVFLSMKLCPPYDKKRQVILITSAQPDEGKTTIAAGLAESFARRKVSVALVDADLRVQKRQRGGAVVGLRDVLTHEAQLDEAIVRTNGISVIRSGSSRSGHPASLIASDTMPVVLDRLRAEHEIVIIDGPPAPVGGESWALSTLADRVLFVVKQSDTSEDLVEEALRALSRKPEEVDVVLNMVKAKDDPTMSDRMMQYYSESSRYYKELRG